MRLARGPSRPRRPILGAELSGGIGAGSPAITGNAQWGIFCAPPPAVPQVPVGFEVASVTGNGAGATNCPPLGIVGWLP